MAFDEEVNKKRLEEGIYNNLNAFLPGKNRSQEKLNIEGFTTNPNSNLHVYQ
jgi:hypothetical protein